MKRAPLEERKKRKQEGDAEPAAAEGAAQQQQQQQPAAKKPRPAKRQPDAAAVAVAEGKHKWMRAVAVGGLTADALPAALAMAKAAGEVRLAAGGVRLWERMCCARVLMPWLRLPLVWWTRRAAMPASAHTNS